MKIVRARFHNYRNFEDIVLNFGSEVTILIGVNEIGKTNLMRGVMQMLNFIISQPDMSRQDEEYWEAVREKLNFTLMDARFGKDSGDEEFNLHFPISTSLVLTCDGTEDLEWTFEKDSLKGPLIDTSNTISNDKFWSFYLRENQELPVLAYFPAVYPHSYVRLPESIKAEIAQGKELSRRDAFYLWDSQIKDVAFWLTYFAAQYRRSKLDNDPTATEFINAITDTLIRSSKADLRHDYSRDIVLKNVSVDSTGRQDEVVFEFEKGVELPYSGLSSSDQRFFSIVLDLVSRAYLLNHNCNPNGIVFLEEPEHHLHPQLQSHILRRLQATFPRIQWVISTHSAWVLSAFDQKEGIKEVYKLYQDGSSVKVMPVGNVRGVSLSDILKTIMDTPDLDSEIPD